MMTGSRGVLTGAGVVVLATALILVIGGSRLVPLFTTAPVSQFRMGPVSGPVSQTIRTDGTPIGAFDLRITTTNGEPGRLALRILDDGDSVIRELVDTLPAGAIDAWHRFEIEPFQMDAGKVVTFVSYVPEGVSGQVSLGAGLFDQYPDGSFTDQDGEVHSEQDLSIRVWGVSGPLGFVRHVAGRDPTGAAVMGLLGLGVAFGVYVETRRRFGRVTAAGSSLALPLLAFVLVFRFVPLTF